MKPFKRNNSDYYYVAFTYQGKQIQKSTGHTNKVEAVKWIKKYVQPIVNQTNVAGLIATIKKLHVEDFRINKYIYDNIDDWRFESIKSVLNDYDMELTKKLPAIREIMDKDYSTIQNKENRELVDFIRYQQPKAYRKLRADLRKYNKRLKENRKK